MLNKIVFIFTSIQQINYNFEVLLSTVLDNVYACMH